MRSADGRAMEAAAAEAEARAELSSSKAAAHACSAALHLARKQAARVRSVFKDAEEARVAAEERAEGLLIKWGECQAELEAARQEAAEASQARIGAESKAEAASARAVAAEELDSPRPPRVRARDCCSTVRRVRA